MDGFYCNFTSYIHSDNLASIAATITNFLEEEKGCHRLSQLPYLMIDTKRIRWRKIWDRPPLLIVALSIGRDGWTVLKTYPNEWLFLRTKDNDRPRLSSIAMQLKCDAFFYRVINDKEGVLLEVNSKGIFRFDLTRSPQFSLIKVPQSFREAIQIDPEIIRREAELEAKFEQQRAEGKFDLQSLATIAEEFSEYNAEYIDQALAKLIDSYQGCWYCFDLFNKVYTNLQQLKEMNVQLLYFYPPDNYLRTLPRYDKQSEEDWDGKEF